ncbi:MAG: DNA adenine methylase [Gammaproteobacteria bacterium]|nr:DNA adenine methylase [Gammaproteobacteria bacterium]
MYIETHLGSGAIMRHKRPTETNIGIDIDEGVLRAWKGSLDVQLVRADAAAFLAGYPFEGDEFVYADPPYLAATRASDRSPYRNDYTDSQHVELLDMLLRLPCHVMISGYLSDVYARRLAGWRTLSFGVRTRSGQSTTEWIWMNYSEPDELHDYRFLGDSFRERERIRRRIERWQQRLERLPPLERRALIAALR